MVIPRAGRAGTAAGEKWRSIGEQAQRPTKRPRASNQTAPATRGGKMKSWLAVAPTLGKILLLVVAGVLLVKSYRVAASAAIFQLRRVDVSGAEHASAEEIRAITRRFAGSAGVWRSDLGTISEEIKRRQGWVRAAVVTRVLPDGLRVRVEERAPRAVVRTAGGQLVWVDEEGIILGPATASTAPLPAFFLHGLDEGDADAARRNNRERMEKYRQMASEWEAANLSERISEVNLMDTSDVRAQLAGQDARIEVRLGKENFGPRLVRALKVLDEQRRTPRGSLITRLDATVERRVIVGFSTGGAKQQQPHDDGGARGQ
jgi:cell division protein FtsQ